MIVGRRRRYGMTGTICRCRSLLREEKRAPIADSLSFLRFGKERRKKKRREREKLLPSPRMNETTAKKPVERGKRGGGNVNGNTSGSGRSVNY